MKNCQGEGLALCKLRSGRCNCNLVDANVRWRCDGIAIGSASGVKGQPGRLRNADVVLFDGMGVRVGEFAVILLNQAKRKSLGTALV